MRRGCVGLFASKDLETWESRPPLFAPRRYWGFECPQVFEIDGTYYLTAAIMEDSAQRYWISPRFEGPYEVPADGGLLAPAGHYAGRVCRWQGRDLYYCWHQPSAQRGIGLRSPHVDWATIRNAYGKFVVAPLVLSKRPDGSLARRSFPGWEAYRAAPLMPPSPTLETLYRGRPRRPDDAWQLESGGGMDVLATPESAENLWLEGTLALDAAAGGLGFRLDDDGGGYFVELRAGQAEVALQKWLPAPDPVDGTPYFRFATLQRGRLPKTLARGDRLPFRLIVVGPYLECTIGDEVILATLSAERVGGRVGLWAESGSVVATELLWAPMNVPQHE